MKKAIPFISAFTLAIACATVLVLQPINLISEDSTRLTVHVGKTIPLIGIAERAGGYRCYVSDAEYFWLSSADCVQEVGDPLRVKFKLNAPAIIYRGEV